MKKAVIMCRVSSDEQAKGYSLGVQLEQLTNYCKRNDIEVVKHYREDHSAKNFNRPEYQKFLQYVKKNKGNIDYLLVTTWDRFSRNVTDSFVMIRELKKFSIEVQAIEQPIDFSIPESKAMLALNLVLPEIDNDRRSIKIRGGIRGSLKAGRWCRKAPVGYKNTRDEQNKPIIVPSDKAQHIQYAYEGILKGKTQSQLRTEIAKFGTKISRNNISLILRNPIYMGKIIVPSFEEEPERLIEGIHQGIISEKMFYAVQELIYNRRKINKLPYSKTERDELPLRGVLHCSKCKKKLTGSPSRSGNGTRYFYYHCNHCKKERYPASKVNTIFESILDDFKFTSTANELYGLIVKGLLSGDEQENERKKAKLKKELEELNNRIEKLQDLLVDEKIDSKSYGTMFSRYSARQEAVKVELDSLNVLDFQYKKWLKDGVNILTDFQKHYSSSTIQEKKELISSIFPENFEFDGEICRTERINDVLRCILQIDKGLTNKKRGQFSKYLSLSSLVETPGIEPGSKQATKILSTCLFFVWFLTLS